MQIQLIKTKSDFTEKDFIKFLENEGIIVKTNTKARGNLGICFANRIDISRNAHKNRRLSILAHEYAHKIHFDIEKKNLKNGGDLKSIFNIENTALIEEELIKITNFVDKNSLFIEFEEKKAEIEKEIKYLEEIIKKSHPNFKKSKSFTEALNYLKKEKSDAIYLLKYDRVRIKGNWLKKEKFYSIDNIEEQFPNLPDFIKFYLKLLSLQRLYKRFYRRKNKAEKYYKKPTELFARFIECFFIEKEQVIKLAPYTFSIFLNLLKSGHYGKLAELFKLAGILHSTY